MPKAAGLLLLSRLRQTWFGSVLALVGQVALFTAPVVRRCFMVSAVQGGTGGAMCYSYPAITRADGPGLYLLVGLVLAAAAYSLAFSRPGPLIAIGLFTAVIWLGTAMLPWAGPAYALVYHDLGLRVTSHAWTAFLMLPSSVAWLAAGVAQLRRIATGPAAAAPAASA